MEPILIYNKSLPQKYLIYPFHIDEDHLPFPLNLDFIWRLMISASLTAILVFGVRFRLKIVAYIRDAETIMNETNILFCLDQVNGLFMAIMLICSISYLMIPVPVAELTGPSICKLWSACRGLYLSGTFVWRCCIAIYRALYIKAQMWLLSKFGVRKLLYVMIITGFGLMTIHCIFSVESGYYGYSKRLCYHWSNEMLDVLRSYQTVPEIGREAEAVCLQCWLKFFSIIGIALIVVEVCCYLVIFHHIHVHNNDVMVGILDQRAIKMRSTTHAVSLAGLLIVWVLEVSHLILAGFLAWFLKNNWNQGLSIFIRCIEFVLVPLVHIRTSPPIIRYLGTHRD